MSGNGNCDALLRQLQSTFNAVMVELTKEREANQRQIQAAWDEIERERTALRHLRRQLEGTVGGAALTMGAGGGTPALASSPSSSGRRPFSSAGNNNNNRAVFTVERPGLAGGAPAGDLARVTFGGAWPSGGTTGSGQSDDDCIGGLRGSQQQQQQPRCPVWITAWPGHTRSGQPRRVLIPRECTFNQLLEHAAQETNCRPVPRMLYTPDGRTLSAIEDVRAGSDVLVIPGGARYSENTVPTLLLEKLVAAAVPVAFQ